MRAIEAFLLHFEHAWQHPWESLAPLLEEVSDEEARWSAPAYRGLEPTLGLPAGSIHWHVHHLTDCKLGYIAELARAIDPGQPPRTDDRLAPCDTFAAERDRLASVRQDEFDQIASLTDDALERTMLDGTPIPHFLTATARHDVWHAGQIATVRRLFRAREE